MLKELSKKNNQLKFLVYLMFFTSMPSVGDLMNYPLQVENFRKLGHLISMFGHSYLLRDTINCLNNHPRVVEGNQSLLDSFVNCTDSELNAPLILALKSRKTIMTKLLLDCPSLKFDLSVANNKNLPIHIALCNKDFKSALRILSIIDNRAINLQDQDGNTPFHLLMRYFGADPYLCQQIAVALLKRRGDLRIRNYI